MLLRRVARPLFASWFVAEGLDVVRHPSSHAAQAQGALTTLLGRLPAQVRQGPAGEVIGYELSDRQLATVVQVHGAALAGAGILLSLNKLPRTAAFALAVLTAPLVLVNLPRRKGTESKLERQARRERFVRALAFTAGAVLAAADHEGRPGLAWRVQKARLERSEAH
ncbi:DoxX family protein [Cellulomonas sp. McL0617]|uniref:DoxX family protein n=1 Tax=Cellulomonas sp. McL0617 TaxID=3415675 RepID=UPI003CF3BABC